MEGGSSLTGPNLAACALALCYAYRDPNVPPSPLCSRLLSHSARLVLSASQTPSTSLEGFLEELRSALDAALSTSSLAVVDPDALIDELCETIRLLLVEAATRPAAFHALFQRVDRVLFRPEDEEHDVDSDDGDDEEIVDEEGNRIPRRPRHIDARSPLGRFLRGIYARYSGADEGSIVKAAAQLDAWVNGQALRPNDQALDEDEKPASARYRLAMLRGDYTTARAVREGSLDQAPGEYDARLHHTLLADAEFYLDTKAFEMARDSLNEALHVARASRDLDFLAVCDRVMRRIQCQEEMYQPAGSITSPGHGGASTMGERFARSDIWELQRGIDRGQPRARVLAFLEESSHQQPASHISGTQRSLLMAQMWSEVGIQEAAAASTKSHTHQLSFVLHEAWQLAEGGDYQAALSMLIDVDLVDRLTFPSYQRWFPALWRIVYLEARRASRSKAVSAIRRIYPDVARDVDGEVATDVDTKAADRDEVMHGRRIRATGKEQLLGQLRTATECFGRVGQRRRALAMVKEVEERAERAQMFVVYRMARLARVEVLLMDDDHVMLDDDEEEENDDGGQEGYEEQGEAGSERRPRKNNGEVARNILEQIIPQCLVDVDVERRAQAKWAYARSLLAHLQARRDAERTVAARDVEAEEQEALQWLEQSEKDYEKAGMLRQQSMVLTAILALLQSGQGQRDSEVETVARRSEAVKMRADEAEHAPFYRPIDERVAQIKSLVGLVGARVVAGA